MKTVVVHKDKNHDVYIGRLSKWGNPFVIGTHGSRAAVIKKYKKWILKQPNLLKSLPELKGKRIACWCSPLACHGDVLAKLADKYQ